MESIIRLRWSSIFWRYVGPVGDSGVEVYDRWTVYGGEGPEGPRMLAVEERRTMGLAHGIDPDRRCLGFGGTALRAAMEAPEVADIRLFVAGIDADNEASRRCAASAGLVAESAEPDRESIIYYRRALDQ